MDWRDRIRTALASAEPPQDDVVEELAQHASALYDAARADGASRDEARGRVEDQIDAWRVEAERLRHPSRRPSIIEPPPPAATSHLGSFGNDARYALRFAVRQLRNAPAFAFTALATVAICVGVNLTIFAVIDAILLRPLPFPDSARLVTIFNTYPKAGVERDGSSLTNYYERRGHIPAFSSLSIYRESTEVVGDTGSTQQERVMRISPDFFTTLGVGPVMGRTFNEVETLNPVRHHAVILTDGYWRQRLNADPQVLGRDIRVNGAPRTIVGVLPPDFRFLSSEARLLLPLTSAAQQRMPEQRHSGGGGTHMIARLQPGATLAQAQSQIDAHNAAVEKDDPRAPMMAEAGFRSPVRSLQADHVRAIRPALWVMQGGALCLLLIGFVNLANLLLIRASTRTKEMAIRQSMGATLRHVVTQAMVETMLLTGLGGLLGLGLGAVGIQLLGVFGADRLPLGAHIAFDGRLAAIGLAVAVLLGVLLALPIAWFNLRSPLGTTLRSTSRGGTASRSAQRLRVGFIVAQIALAFVLLAGAGLLGVSLTNVMAVSPGFRADHVITGQFMLPYTPFGPGRPERITVLDRLLDGVRRQPGVAAAGTITNIPLSGDNGKSAITPMGYVPKPGESLHGHYAYSITGDYFSAAGIPLHEGRFLTSADSHRPARVCVVDEDFARYYWPAGGAVGRRVYRGSDSNDDQLFTIVGVVGSVKQADLTELQGQGAMYVPYRFQDSATIFVVTRTSQQPEAFADSLRTIFRDTEPDLAVDDIRSMETRIADSLVGRRSPALLAALVAGVALILAAVGTYGVLSYTIAQRRREIGVRMALGAQTGQIRMEFVGLGLRLLGAGILFGVSGMWVAGRAMQSVLFGVPALHLPTLLGAALVIGSVSVVACLIPARRASRVDPMIALAAD